MTRRHVVAGGIGVWLTVVTAALVLIVTNRDAGPHWPQASAKGDTEKARPTLTKETIMSSKLHRSHAEGTERISCDGCHAVGAKEFLKPKKKACVKCHGKTQVEVHALATEESATECLGCHDFLETGDVMKKAWDCLSCHGDEKTKTTQVVVHRKERCSDCHQVHKRPSLQPKQCVDCHEKEDGHHGKLTSANNSTCLDCHTAHGKAILPAKTCANCHAKKRPLVSRTALFAGHDKCTECHQPHEFVAGRTKRCQSCHTGEHALASAKVAKHADCRNCHKPHNPLGRVRSSCVKCHKVRSKHPASAKGRCLGCHPAHPAGSTIATTTLTGTLKVTRTPSTVRCTSCHTKATNDKSFHSGKATCNDCHATHVLTPKSCGQCHEPQLKLVANNKGHKKCDSCHEAHTPDLKPPSCASCHKTQRATAPKGHRKCETCHVTHSGALTAKAQTCNDCHKPQVRTVHARKVRGGCKTCHRPHGPKGIAKSPTCASCHTTARLPSLHKTAKHQRCGDCHTSTHKPMGMTRQTCLTCHKDQRTHEPKAKSCIGCHPFGKRGRR